MITEHPVEPTHTIPVSHPASLGLKSPIVCPVCQGCGWVQTPRMESEACSCVRVGGEWLCGLCHGQGLIWDH